MNNCRNCAENYQVCKDNSERLNKIITNAGGHMGRVTFTLEWHGDADLDLWFFCR